MSSSTYFFIAQLLPEQDCWSFYPGEISLDNGWVLDICFDLAAFWNPKLEQNFDEIKSSVGETFNVLTALYSFSSQKPLTFRLQHWVEAKQVLSKDNVIGIFKSKSAPKGVASARHPSNRRWRRVCRAFRKIQGEQNLRLALKDYVSAMKDGGDDAFFFAYRAIENVCRKASGCTGDILPKDWSLMHQKLGTTKDQITPLTLVAQEIRHGNIASPILSNARSNRTQILEISRKVLAAEFRRSLNGFY